MDLTFTPIDIENTVELCMRFRLDSYRESFGTDDLFYKENGANGEKYFEFLQKRHAQDPNYILHVWLGEKIIGQVEMGPLRDLPQCGYINLYYLIPEMREKGYGRQLDDYATAYLKGKGFTFMRLSVSSTNHRALRFYARTGWCDIGIRADRPHMRLMEKKLS